MDGYYEELGGMLKGFFTRNKFIKRDENHRDNTFDFITERNNTDIYKSIYSYSNLEIDSCLLNAPLYIDLDMDSIDNDKQYKKLQKDLLMVHSYLVNILKVPKESISVYFSGHKGYHILVPQRVFGVDPSTDLNEKYKKIALEIKKNTLHDTVDIKIYDKRRLFRLANSKHGKTGLYKVPITIEKAGKEDYEFIRDYASHPRMRRDLLSELNIEAKRAFDKIVDKEEKKPIRSNSNITIFKTNKLLPCVVSILTNGVPKGMRNETAVATASALMQTGKSKEEVMEIMLDWNQVNDPPMREGDIHTTVNSAHRMIESNRGYGCNTFKMLGLCTSNCDIGGVGNGR